MNESNQSKIWELMEFVDNCDLSFFRQFNYVGFQPVEMRRSILSNKKFENENLYILLTYYLAKGTNLRKISAELSGKYREKFDKARTKMINCSGKAITNNDVTIGRLASCFPEVCALILVKNRRLVRPSKDYDLPYFLRFTSAPSIISRTDQKTFDQWVEWANDFSLLIQKKVNVKASENNPSVYWEATWNSSLFTDDKRIEIVKNLEHMAEKIKIKEQAEILVSTSS